MIKEDPLYETKFVCFNTNHAETALTPTEISILCILLEKIEDKFPGRQYLCINQDEPYAEKVWEIIKEEEQKKNGNK